MEGKASSRPRGWAQVGLVERLKTGRLTDLDRKQVHRAWVLFQEREKGRGWPMASRIAGYKDPKDAKSFVKGDVVSLPPPP